MYASLTSSSIRDPVEDANEIAAMAGEAMDSWLREIDGYAGLLMLVAPEAATVQAITFWESRDVAERHREARMRLRDRITETVSVDVEGTTDYEVVFSRLPPG
jgi:hypothetical protein